MQDCDGDADLRRKHAAGSRNQQVVPGTRMKIAMSAMLNKRRCLLKIPKMMSVRTI